MKRLVLQPSGDMYLALHRIAVYFSSEVSFLKWFLVIFCHMKGWKKVPERHSSTRVALQLVISSSIPLASTNEIKTMRWIYEHWRLIALNYRREQCSCLLDKPHRDMIEKNGNTMLAGEKFTDDQQCELVFGPGARICSYMPKCSRLWCSQSHKEDNGCRTQHMPWADGTKCGEGEWCQKGECVTRNRSALAPIHGNWGPWSEWVLLMSY